MKGVPLLSGRELRDVSSSKAATVIQAGFQRAIPREWYRQTTRGSGQEEAIMRETSQHRTCVGAVHEQDHQRSGRSPPPRRAVLLAAALVAGACFALRRRFPAAAGSGPRRLAPRTGRQFGPNVCVFNDRMTQDTIQTTSTRSPASRSPTSSAPSATPCSLSPAPTVRPRTRSSSRSAITPPSRASGASRRCHHKRPDRRRQPVLWHQLHRARQLLALAIEPHDQREE